MRRSHAEHIPPRARKFDFGQYSKVWYHKDRFLTYHFNTMALLIPLLEFMVIGCIRRVKGQLNESLRLEVNSLLLQEGHHAHAFSCFNREVVARYYGKDILKLRFDLWRRLVVMMPQKMRLAACAFGEHLALIGSELVLNEDKWFTKMPTDIKSVWYWHSLEEIEHKHVAMDVYRCCGGGYFTRIFSAMIFLMLFLVHYCQIMFRMMRCDGVFGIFSFFKLLKMLWLKPGLFRVLLKPFFHYFVPFFHPNQRSHETLLKRYGAYLDLQSGSVD